ncbi:MAG: sporulation protein YqfC [Syntrophomonadaceae bacterium]|nr:sporulation protein YqfC [Syntrophomonadaceae bacterium]
MEKRREVIGRVMAEFLEIPQDLVLDIPKLSIIGRHEIYVENHKGIIEYYPHRLRVNLSRGFVEIEGSDLEIKALMTDEMYIGGIINSIKYHD